MTTLRGWLVILAVLLLTACHSYKNEDYAAMNTLSMNMVCVGRMLIALPKGTQSWQQQFNHANVKKLPATVNSQNAFDTYIEQRVSELEDSTIQNPGGQLFRYFADSNRSAVILFRKKGIQADSVHTERYLWTGYWGYLYETGALADQDAVRLASMASRHFGHVVPINNTNPPDQAGFCIDSALVTGDTGPIGSGATVNVKGWPGVVVHAGTSEDDGTQKPLSWRKNKRQPKRKSLFERLEDEQKITHESSRSDDDTRRISLTVLRKGYRTLHGIRGQQTAYRIELANGQLYYKFQWLSENNLDRPRHTGVGVMLHAGARYLKADYHAPPPADELLALWDAMLESLKPRTGFF